jgi:ArsR family transcriptional regulator
MAYNISVHTDMNTSTIPSDLLGFLKSLASESRLNIILLFLDGQERSVNQIAESIGLGQPATSEHLAVLKQSGVLLARKDGKEMYYFPDRTKVLAMLKTLDTLLRSCCD